MGRRHLPLPVTAQQSLHFVRCEDVAATLTELAQETPMDEVHVEISRVGIKEDPPRIAFAQDRKDLAGGAFGNLAQFARLGEQVVGSVLLPLGHEKQRLARRQQRGIGETLRRRVEERLAGAGEGQHGRWAVVGLEARSRPPGAVEARALLHLEDADTFGAGEMRRHRCACDARTDQIGRAHV